MKYELTLNPEQRQNIANWLANAAMGDMTFGAMGELVIEFLPNGNAKLILDTSLV